MTLSMRRYASGTGMALAAALLLAVPAVADSAGLKQSGAARGRAPTSIAPWTR